MMLKRIFAAMSAPLDLESRDFVPEQENLAWLRPRAFERILLKISIYTLLLSFIFGVIAWWFLSFICAISASFFLVIYLWLMQQIFSFKKLFDIIFMQEDASKYAKNHLYGAIIQIGCFLITWLFTFAAWIMDR